MFKRKGGGGERPFEQCSKKLHFSYGTASLSSMINIKQYDQFGQDHCINVSLAHPGIAPVPLKERVQLCFLLEKKYVSEFKIPSDRKLICMIYSKRSRLLYQCITRAPIYSTLLAFVRKGGSYQYVAHKKYVGRSELTSLETMSVQLSQRSDLSYCINESDLDQTALPFS